MNEHLDGTGSAHPILRCLDTLERELDDLVDAPTWSLDAAETTQVITRLATHAARIDELEARAVKHAETLQVPSAGGFRSTAAWLARLTRITRTAAARKTRLATALAGHEQTRHAMARGEVHAEQALVIDHAVDDLTDDHAQHRDLAEKHLLTAAGDFDAHALTTLGRRILETIDPAGADEHEARLLEAQEARARRRTALRLWDDGDGLTHGTFSIPVAQGSHAPQGPARPRRAQARPRHRRRRQLRPPDPHTDEARPGVLHLPRALPQRPAPPARRPDRLGRGHRRPRDPASASTRPRTSTPGSRSHPASCAAGRARPGSTPPSSTRRATSSTSAAAPACTPPPNAWR